MMILKTDNQSLEDLKFYPVTPDRWKDLELLFGPRGAVGGCWCMYWRLKHADFEHLKGEGNRQALKTIVDSGSIPGILAYDKDQPIGWCSVAPRQDLSTLERSRILKPVDDQAVWSVVCFFIAKPYRRQGVTTQILQAAIQYARQNGAKIVEGYPKDMEEGNSSPDPFVFTGLMASFLKAGFVEVERRSETRPIMRYTIES